MQSVESLLRGYFLTMSNDPSTSLPPSDKVIRKNPKVNASVVAAHERLEQELKKLGVEIKPSSYNIEPAFGRHPFRIRNPTKSHNHNRSATKHSKPQG